MQKLLNCVIIHKQREFSIQNSDIFEILLPHKILYLHRLKQNKMISTNPTQTSSFLNPNPNIISNTNRHSSHHLSQDSFKSHHSSLTKYDNFMQRFKLNQHQLRNKFKLFILKQKQAFPQTHQMISEHRVSPDEDEPVQNVRSIRKEKKRLIQEMSHNMNQSQYYLHRNQEFEKTCTLLERRVRKVASIRQERKSEAIRLQNQLRSISVSIQEEKRRFRDAVKDSRDNIARSKLQCSRRKLTQAQTIRNESQLIRSKISDQRAQSENYNKKKYQSVKQTEKNVELSVSRIVQDKIHKAQEVKLERLFRQLAEKEEVKINSIKVSKEAPSTIAKYKRKTIQLQQKIGQYRKCLGESPSESTPKITLTKFKNKRYFTEEHQFSTKSGFLTANKEVTYADESFDD